MRHISEEQQNALRARFENLVAKRYPHAGFTRERDGWYEDAMVDCIWEGFLLMAMSVTPLRLNNENCGAAYEWGSTEVMRASDVTEWVKRNAPYALFDARRSR